jgi:hypothetical protein
MPVIVIDVLGQDGTQVRFAEDEDLVGGLSTGAPAGT